MRLWPGVTLVVVQWVLVAIFGMLGGIAVAPFLLVWWLGFSRAPWLERVGVLGLMVVLVAATLRVVDPSMANGAMGWLVPILSMPVLGLALVAALVLSRGASTSRRRAAIAGAVVLGCGVFTVLRTSGISGEGGSDLHWRWTPTAEERLLAEAAPLPSPLPIAAAPAPAPAPAPAVPGATPSAAATAPPPAAPEPAVESTAPVVAWSGFRGPNRDGVIPGVRIDAAWSSTPPALIWRRKIGPGWSSFAVAGDRLYTQEQRGDEEVVSCYAFETGEPVWAHRDPVRFWESNGGAGPRATPLVHAGRVFTLGATGVLNALDAATGARLWTRNAAEELGRRVPGWGFAGSPIVVGDVVIIALSGQLAAYDVATGEPRWNAEPFGGGYSSPHLATIAGVTQVVLLTGAGAVSVAPDDGAVLWRHEWETGVAIVQPAATPDGDLLLSGANMTGLGMRRIHASRDAGGGWTTVERWTSRGLKPYFNDFVVHKGHAYGFDGSILAAIDLTTGERVWKGGRYGSGQLVLLPDQDLLLVIAEEGGLALVGAVPDGYAEVARAPGIEGKTWNHPVVIGNVLLVRNGEEMAAFRLR